jgi:hypothetical protein
MTEPVDREQVIQDLLDHVQHNTDAAMHCLVEVEPDAFVVTRTREQATLLRGALSVRRAHRTDLPEVSLGDGLVVHTPEPDVLTRVIDSLRDDIRDLQRQLAEHDKPAEPEPQAADDDSLSQMTDNPTPPPVKRGPGRPRKATTQ